MSLGGKLKDKLKDKKVLVTGVTGFVGEALLHRIIGELPDTTVVAIIRSEGKRVVPREILTVEGVRKTYDHRQVVAFRRAFALLITTMLCVNLSGIIIGSYPNSCVGALPLPVHGR